MNNLKAIVADDEEQLRVYLVSQLAKVWPGLTVCAEAKNGKEALAVIEEHQPDIAFLDIKMPGLSGMEVARQIAGKCWVVFITAYNQYAVEAFENEAIDYIMKPVTTDRLKKTMERIKSRIISSSKPAPDLSHILEKLMTGFPQKESSDYIQWIRAQHGSDIRLIPVEDICYVKASDKYTIVVTKDGESVIRKPVKELASELSPDSFWQINRGTIINVSAIDKVSRSVTGRFVVKLKDPPEILTVSRTYSHLFKQM